MYDVDKVHGSGSYGLLWNNPVLNFHDDCIVDYIHRGNLKCTKLYRYNVRLIYEG